jgi:hypothetical protein
MDLHFTRLGNLPAPASTQQQDGNTTKMLNNRGSRRRELISNHWLGQNEMVVV